MADCAVDEDPSTSENVLKLSAERKYEKGKPCQSDDFSTQSLDHISDVPHVKFGESIRSMPPLEYSSIDGQHSPILTHSTGRRRHRSGMTAHHSHDSQTSLESPMAENSSRGENWGLAEGLQYEIVKKPENVVEAHRMANNYLFGFKKWKSHLTRRALDERSDIVKSLYEDEEPIFQGTEEITHFNCCNVIGNVSYVILFGWWLSLVYLLLALLMTITIIGRKYGSFCLKLSLYFLWPFEKFVHMNCPESYKTLRQPECGPDEDVPLITAHTVISSQGRLLSSHRKNYWLHPGTYVWLILAVPLLVLLHSIVFIVSWMLVIFIPISKVNLKAIKGLLLLHPDLLYIGDSNKNPLGPTCDIIVFTHQAVNVYYYKYTVDGMNVILVNLLCLVVLTLGLGYGDEEDKICGREAKFVLALLAVIPLAYYIGMAISSISAQSNFAIGAVLNATFGSVVEIILYISALVKGKGKNTTCYAILVKSALVGTLLATTMLIPGLAMIIGGLKHRTQSFNRRSVGVSATLLFVSTAAMFAPSIYSRSYGRLDCELCENITTNSSTWNLYCDHCQYDVDTGSKGQVFYAKHVTSLVYACAVLLPISYIVGLIFSLKTHRSHIYDTIAAEIEGEDDNGHAHTAHWGRVKSLLILFVATVLMSLCAEVITSNIQPLLESGLSVYFIGVTLLALIPDLPEIVNGIQFALQNNISLSIEVGASIAVQVGMLQIPILVAANLIYDMSFQLIFSDIHIWSSIFGVLMMNFVFQDGKSDYFQGSALVMTYISLMLMYFFLETPADMVC